MFYLVLAFSSNKKQDIENIISNLPDSKRLEAIKEKLQKHINVKDTNNITEQANSSHSQSAETKPVAIVPPNNAVPTSPIPTTSTEEKLFTPPPPPMPETKVTEHKNAETTASNSPPLHLCLKVIFHHHLLLLVIIPLH
ncbi:hypothetical protein [Rickettsia endosymbiont of Gonocerus acuteangulatus]|uniref:hypothetical protein n=1 Tax=Rickettsia endosymbiont of Gonocerus acuteangulatus TaxID=3066266 RepID=UPI00313307E3